MAWGERPSRCLVHRGGQPSGSVVPIQQLQLYQGQNTLHSLEGRVLGEVPLLPTRHTTFQGSWKGFSPRLQGESSLKSQEGLGGSGFPGAQCQAARSVPPQKPGTLIPGHPGQATSTRRMRYLATGHSFYWVCPSEILG